MTIAPPPASRIARPGGLEAKEHAAEIHGERARPVLGRDVEHVPAGRDAGVEVREVERAEALHHVGDHALVRAAIRHVERERHGLAAGLRDLLGHALGAGPFRSVTATRAPRAASSFALARPMPEAAPVTSATRPSSRPCAISLASRCAGGPQ